MGMQLYISAATQHINTILTAVLVRLLPLYYFVCVYVCFKLLEHRFQIYIEAYYACQQEYEEITESNLGCLSHCDTQNVVLSVSAKGRVPASGTYNLVTDIIENAR